jgi:AcrR family transcriptional regulator
LIHHYPTKVALIKAVVERFTTKFEAVADATNTDGPPREKLARHMQSSVALMRTAPEMFAVLNEILMRARRDAEMSRLVSVPLGAWKQYIVSLILTPLDEGNAAARSEAGEIATACMAQLLGMGLLLNSSGHDADLGEPGPGPAESRAIAALSRLVDEAE